MNFSNNPLVSVIIPTYKRPHMLARAIESVLNQTYINIEIIIVDDNSIGSSYRKETIEFMRRYSEYNNILYVKHKENKGGSVARNTGIAIAKGKFVTFLDDDDEYMPTKIEMQINKFRESNVENLGFVYCQINLYDENNLLVGRTKNYFKGNIIPFNENMMNTIAGTPAIMALRSTLVEVNGFKDLKSGQDWYLILQILNMGYHTDYLEESLVKVHVHNEERITNNISKLNSLVERYELKEKYFHLLTNDSIKLINYKHYLQIANFLKYQDKKESIRHFKKALKYKKISKENIRYLISLMMGNKVVNIVKRFLTSKQ